MSAISRLVIVFLCAFSLTANAELPWQSDDHTRYLALGDSLTAGQGADPTTNGYAYLLYRDGIYDVPVLTLFADAAVPGVTSGDLLAHQVPLAGRFPPDVITLTVGGNDLIAIVEHNPPLAPEQVPAAIGAFASNLGGALVSLCGVESSPEIYVGNLYEIPELGPELAMLVGAFNDAIAMTVDNVASTFGCKVVVADVHAAFKGRSGLLNIEREGADWDEVHPTNSGYKVMERAFIDARF